MRVSDVMVTDVVTVSPETPFKQIVETLLASGISGVPVVDDHHRVLGIVTEADVVSRQAYAGHRRRPLALVGHYLVGHDPAWLRKSCALRAWDIMTAHPLTASPGDMVGAAARRMLEMGVKRLPVVADGRLVGIVGRSDLLRTYLRSDAEIERELAVLLHDARRVPETHAISFRVTDGVVTLDGWVDHRTDSVLIRHEVERVPGVVAVKGVIAARRPEPQPQ